MKHRPHFLFAAAALLTLSTASTLRARSCRLARYFFALLSLIALMSSLAPRAYAITNTWTGQGASTNGNWSAATNWGGTAPDGADNIIFDGTTGLTNTNNLAVNGTANVNINLLFATNAGAFVLNGTNATASALILTGPGVLTNLSTNLQTINFGLTFQTATANIDTASNSVILSGIIAGTNITKAGAATLFLNGTNTFTGIVTNNAGAIRVGNNSGLGTTNSGTVIVSGAALELTTNNAGGNLSIGAESLSLAGTGISSGGALRNITGSSTYGGLITLTDATRINADAGTLLLTNTGTITGATFGLTFGGAGNITLNSIIGTTTGTVTKDGAGTLTLSAANTYTGGTTINAGTLAFSNNNALGTGTVTFASNSTTLKTLANLNVTNAIALTTDGTIDSGAFTLTNSGAISGAGALIKAGTGTTVLASSNTYTGVTTISAGALQIGNGGASGSLGSGAVTNNASLIFKRSNALNVTNIISGTGNLTQAGTGTTTLSGSNGYTGTTAITAGTLLFSNATSLYGGSDANWTAANIIVSSNATAAFGVGGDSSFTTSNVTTLLGNLTTVNSNGLQAGSFIGFDTTAGAFTLTNNVSNSTGTGGGAIGLSKIGTGTLTLIGSNSYTGATTVDGGQLYVTGRISNAAALNVGSNNSGIGMVISGGGTVQNAAGTIGYTNTSSNNSVLVTGVGSIWSNSADLSVGNQGSGNSMVISNGGKVVNGGGIIGSSNTSSNNSVLVTDTGSLWTNGSTYTGSQGSSNSLVISNGAVVRDAFAYIGFGTNSSNNSVLVTGSNSQLINATAVKLGYAGSGNSLVISNGARVSGINGTVGETTNTATNNLLMVTGTGSRLNLSGGMTFGWAGGGNSLVISDGGTVTSVNTYIGNNASASNNSVLVTDAGSSWTNTSSPFSIGSSSAGNSMVISNGGKVVTLIAGTTLGQYLTSSNNSVLVTGTGSLFSNAASLTIGLNGGGTVTVANGGSIAGGTTIAASNGSTGTLNIGRFGGSDTAGSITGSIGFGSGTGMINFNQTDSNNLTNIISGAGSVNQLGTGTTTLTGANTYSGVTTISAGTLQIGNGGASGSLGSGAVTNNASLIFKRSNALNVTNIISGTGNLTQAGTGTTTLSGSNGYTGTTAITAGTLLFSNATSLYGGSDANWTAANIIVASNATAAFDVGGASSFTTSNVTTLLGNLTTVNSNGLQAGSSIGFDTTAGAFTLTNDVSDSTGTGGGALGLSKLGTGTLILSGSNSYSGGTTIRAGVLTMGNVSALGSSNNAVTDNGTLDLNSNNASMAGLSGSGIITNSAGANNLTLGNNNGSGTFTGSINSAIALIKNGTGTQTLSGSNAYSQGTTLNAGTLAISNNSALGTGTVTFASNSTTLQALANLNVTNSITLTTNGIIDSGAFVLTNSGILSSGGSLTKAGAGTLILSGLNTYGGTTTVGGGTLQVTNLANAGANSGIGTNGTIILTNGGVLSYAGTTNTSMNRGINLASGDGGLGVSNSARSVTISGVISNTGNLVKSGAGTLILSASNSFTGTTTVSAGALVLGNTNALSGSTLAGVAYFGSLTGANLGGLQGSNNLALTNDSGTALALSVGGNNSNTTYSGILSGSGSLAKAGTGTLILSGLNTYGGATTVGGGTLQVTNLANAGANSGIGTNGTIILTNGGVLSYAGTTNTSMNRGINLAAGNGDIGVSNSAAAVTLSGVISNTGNFVKSGAGTLILSASNSYTGTTTVSAGVLSLGNTNALSGSTLDYSSAGTVSFGALTGANLGGLQGSTNLALTNDSGTAVALSVGGNNSNTTYSGILSGNGSLAKAGTGTMFLGAANTYTGGTTINAGTLAISNGSSFGSNAVTFASNGTTVAALASMQVTNNYVLTGNGTMNVGTNIMMTNSGVISGAGSLTKSGTGTLLLSSSSNSYGGVTTISGGALQVTDLTDAGFVSPIGTNGTITLTNGGNFDYVGTASSGASMNRAFSLAGGDGGIGVSDSSVAVTLSGAISDMGNLVKRGAGTLILSASNSYTGATTVSAGTLELASLTGSAAGSASSLTVANGATLLLSQSDQVNNSATVTLSGGTITRGSGVSEVFGNLNLTAASFLDFGSGAAGNMTFGTYQNNTTPSALLTLNNFLPGNSFTFNSTSFSQGAINSYFQFGTGFVNYSLSNTGSTFTITAIPEPSTYVAALGLLALMLWPLRRRLRVKFPQ